MPGDERWPSWTRDGRIVFSQRAPKGEWHLFAVSGDGSRRRRNAHAGRRAPNGRRASRRMASASRSSPIASRRRTTTWMSGCARCRRKTPRRDAPAAPVRVTRAAGDESHPVWAPDNARVAYAATRGGSARCLGRRTCPTAEAAPAVRPDPGRSRRAWSRRRSARGAPRPRRGHAGARLASWRRAGLVARRPDAAHRDLCRRQTPPTTAIRIAMTTTRRWRLRRPGSTRCGASPRRARWTQARRCRRAARARRRALDVGVRPGLADAEDAVLPDRRVGAGVGRAPRRSTARRRRRRRTPRRAEDVIDRMIAEQPLIKPAVESSRGVVASGNPLASAAGALVLEKGGNVVDAGIAVSFALGVVEPDASSIGGDGQAILVPQGHDRAGRHRIQGHDARTRDAATIRRSSRRTGAARRPTVRRSRTFPASSRASICSIEKYGSKKVAWADLVAPAIKLADEGFVLDEALPTTIAEGRASFAKYPEAAKVFMPGGKVPEARRSLRQQGLRRDAAHDREGRRRSRSIAARSRAASPTTWPRTAASSPLDDLAQYRAIERKPLVGRYRDHLVYSVPPPVADRRADRRDAADSRQLRAAAPARPTRPTPTTCTTSSRPGACATAAQRIADPGALAGRPRQPPRGRRTRSTGSS